MSVAPRFFSRYKENRSDLLLAGLLFFGALGVYLCTMSRSFGLGDSSELTTAAYFLGVGHSPGYPTFMLIGYLFSHLPFGTVALRMNFMSAFFGALAVALSYFVFKRISPGRFGAFLGAAAFAFTATLWDLTNDADVHTLHLTFVALIVLLLLKWRESGKPHLAWAALVFGLSLGNHALTTLLLPGIFFWIIATKGWRYLPTKPMLLATLAVCLGLLVYLYLPIRGLANPPPKVSDPHNLKEFILQVTAPGSRQVMFHEPALKILGRIYMYGARLRQEVSWGGILLGLLGTGLLWRRDRKLFAFLMLIFGCNIFYSVNFNIFDIYAYFAASYWVFCGIIGLGGEQLIQWVERGLARVQGAPDSLGARERRALAGTLLMLLPFWLLTGHWKMVDASKDRSAEETARTIMKMVDKDSLIMGDWWAIAPLGYLKYIEGARPDVSLSVAFSLHSQRGMEKNLAREYLSRFPAVYATEILTYGVKELQERYVVIPQGPLFRVYVNGVDPKTVVSEMKGAPRFRFGDSLALIDWEIHPLALRPPGLATLDLYWQTLKPQTAADKYDVIVGLTKDSRDWAWREKTALVHGLYPLASWKVGQTLVQHEVAFLTSDACAPGEYHFTLRVRHRNGQNRLLPVAAAEGKAAEREATLGDIMVRGENENTPTLVHKDESTASTKNF